MLEIAIIICLAILLFLILKNYTKVEIAPGEIASVESDFTGILPMKKRENFLKKFFAKRENFDDIKDEIEKGQERIVAPAEINKAKQTFREEDPEVAQLLLESSKAFEENDLRNAEDLAIEALIKDKKCSPAYVNIGRVAFHRGSFADAKESYKTALKCDRESGDAYFGLGQIEIREDNISDAIEHFQRAVSLDRGNAMWYGELGKAYMQARQYAKAAKALKRAASLDMENKEYKELASEAEDKQRAHSKAWGNKR